MDGRRHGQPRVEPRDGCVGPEAEVGAGVEQRAQRERARLPVGPQRSGDVAVVEQVRGLDARPHAERGEAGQVGVGDELHVLERAAGAGRLDGVEGRADGGVADGVHGHLEAAVVRPPAQVGQLGGRQVDRAASRCVPL